MQDKSGIELALGKFENSPTKLARAVGGSVVRQHVEHWLKSKRVPSDVAPDVERATGIPVEVLCPGVSWEVIRGKKAPKVPQAPAHIESPATGNVTVEV